MVENSSSSSSLTSSSTSSSSSSSSSLTSSSTSLPLSSINGRRAITCAGPDDDLSQYLHHYNCESDQVCLPRNVTAFRMAERLYKYRITPSLATTKSPLENVHKKSSIKKWISMHKERVKESPLVPDIPEIEKAWSNVIDFRNFEWNTRENQAIMVPLFDQDLGKEYYTLQGLEGFAFFPNYLDNLNEQKEMIKNSFGAFSDRPNRTNLDLLYEIPGKGVLQCYLDGDKVSKKKEGSLDEKKQQNMECEGILIDEEMVRKWRWTTIGKGYDWDTKEYSKENSENSEKTEKPLLPHQSIIPVEIARICKSVAKCLGFKEYEPNAGIINFYQFRDSLTGHVDRSEVNHNAPLVSISLGETGIFLLGGSSRNSKPIHAMAVRSGDILVMSGHCRLFFHGIPRIVENDNVSIYQNDQEGKCDCHFSEYCNEDDDKDYKEKDNDKHDYKQGCKHDDKHNMHNTHNMHNMHGSNLVGHKRTCWSRIYPIAKGTRINLNVRQFQ